jgi:hypothetical protein
MEFAFWTTSQIFTPKEAKMSVHIRAAQAHDVPVLAQLIKEYWRFEGIMGFDGKRIDGLLREVLSNSDRGMCLIAESDKAACGYLLLVYVFSLEHGGVMAVITSTQLTS